MKYIVFLITLLFAGVALAQDTTVNLGSLLAPWLEMLVGAFAVLMAAILGWIATMIKQKTGIDIEARHREALQQALTNGAGLIMNKLGDKLSTTDINVHHPAIREAILYVSAAAPDAIENFGLLPEQLAEKIVAKLGLAQAPNTIEAPK